MEWKCLSPTECENILPPIWSPEDKQSRAAPTCGFVQAYVVLHYVTLCRSKKIKASERNVCHWARWGKHISPSRKIREISLGFSVSNFIKSWSYTSFFVNLLSYNSIAGCLSSKVVFHQMLSSIKGKITSKVVFYERSSSIKGWLPLQVVFHQIKSSIKACLPSKVIFHLR